MADKIKRKFRAWSKQERDVKLLKKTEKELQADLLARQLKIVAFTIWLIALMLPAFRTAEGNAAWGYWLGGVLLLLMPVAFLGAYPIFSSLALYANLFFWSALLRQDGRRSVKIMWLMAATVFLLRAVMISERPQYSYVVSWGWGAVLWLFSYAVLTLAVFVRHHPTANHKRIIKSSLVACGLVIIALLCLHYSQYYRMSRAERRELLPFSMAFTVKKIYGNHPPPTAE